MLSHSLQLPNQTGPAMASLPRFKRECDIQITLKVLVIILYQLQKRYETTCLEIYIYLFLVKCRVKLKTAVQITLCLGNVWYLYFLLKYSFLASIMMLDQTGFSNPEWTSLISCQEAYL